MNETNPFDAPATLPEGKRTEVKPRSVVVGSMIGGLVGLALGVAGVVALCFFVQGMPGVLEILILFIGISVLLVIPGLAIGAALGASVNRKKDDS